MQEDFAPRLLQPQFQLEPPVERPGVQIRRQVRAVADGFDVERKSEIFPEDHAPSYRMRYCAATAPAMSGASGNGLTTPGTGLTVFK